MNPLTSFNGEAFLFLFLQKQFAAHKRVFSSVQKDINLKIQIKGDKYRRLLSVETDGHSGPKTADDRKLIHYLTTSFTICFIFLYYPS